MYVTVAVTGSTVAVHFGLWHNDIITLIECVTINTYYRLHSEQSLP